MRVIWTNAAIRDVTHIYDYLADLNPQAARKVAAALLQTGDSLENLPHRGRPVPQTDMRELVTAYPYILRYRIDEEEVLILRVRHTARQPTNP